MWLYLVLSMAMAVTYNAAERRVYRLSLAALQRGVISRLGLHPVQQALEDVGAFAVEGLGPGYARALATLHKEAPDCLNTLEKDGDNGVRSVTLEDGSRRLTLAKSSEEEAATMPPCIREAAAGVTAAFEQVEAALTNILAQLVGSNNSLTVRDDDQRRYYLDQLPTKTHLHVYLRPQADRSDLVTNEIENGLGRKKVSDYSLPYHVDNGLYLLVTPSASLPLLLRSRSGAAVRSDMLAADSLLVLLGRGLTNWLLPTGHHQLIPARHAVPSLAGTAVRSRTILARMTVAQSASLPLVNPAAGPFSDAFFGSAAADRSPASLCEFGAPLTEAESRLSRRRRQAACWPHTGEGCGPRKWNGRGCTDKDKVDAGRGAGSCLNDAGCPDCAPFCSRSGYCQNHRP